MCNIQRWSLEENVHRACIIVSKSLLEWPLLSVREEVGDSVLHLAFQSTPREGKKVGGEKVRKGSAGARNRQWASLQMRLGALSVCSNPITAEGPWEISPPNKSATLHQTSFPSRGKKRKGKEREREMVVEVEWGRSVRKMKTWEKSTSCSLMHKFTSNGTGWCYCFRSLTNNIAISGLIMAVSDVRSLKYPFAKIQTVCSYEMTVRRSGAQYTLSECTNRWPLTNIYVIVCIAIRLHAWTSKQWI